MEAAFVARGGHGIFQCRACSLLQKVEKQLLVCGDTKVPNVHLERATVSATIAMEINHNIWPHSATGAPFWNDLL